MWAVVSSQATRSRALGASPVPGFSPVASDAALCADAVCVFVRPGWDSRPATRHAIPLTGRLLTVNRKAARARTQLEELRLLSPELQLRAGLLRRVAASARPKISQNSVMA